MKKMIKRTLSWVLTLAMVLSFLPAIALQSNAVAEGFITDRVVDNSTMDQWKAYFGPDHLDTEFAGAVWTDKSVFKDASAFAGVSSISGETVKMLDADNNFLVALSAIASTKEIVGYSTIPTDTMLVLDLSGSMVPETNVDGYQNVKTLDISNVEAMVKAANDAIYQLTRLNNYNRVGVVVYSGNSVVGASGAGTAQVLLPLGRYNGVAVNNPDGSVSYEYLQMDLTTDTETVRVLVEDNPGNRNDVWQNVRVEVVTDVAVATKTNLKREDGSTVAANDKEVVGGTYVQGGMYLAWRQFAAATDTTIATGNILGGTKRMPIMVLMSDGAPTTATHNYAGTAQGSIGTSTTGRGTATTASISFLTQLTAAWVRASMEAHYGRGCKFYTLGLGDVQSSDVGLCVLDPSVSPDTVTSYWDTITASGTQNMVLTTPSTTDSNETVQLTVAKNSLITSADQINYVDKYFAADDAQELSEAFGDIVDEIIIQSRYYPTLVTSGQHDLDGYVTFTDELGEFMEVKDVKGLVVGNTLFSGGALAKAMQDGTFGNAATYTEYGWELVNSVAERLGVAADAAIPILQNAWRDGQLHYANDSDYSNFIGWYADANGNFLDAWHSADTAADYPDGTAYLNKSYGFLGVSEGNIKDSDMMHTVVMVSTDVNNGHQSVTFKIPAALIPMVTYKVQLEGDSLENAKNITLTQETAEPIRLLFEVGLQDRVNALTVQSIMENAEHKHETADGRYYFYSNRWGSNDHNAPSIDYSNPHTHLATVSHLHPSEENERYYYIENTKLYADANGTALYTGSGKAYTPRSYFTASVSGGAAVVTTEYVEVSAEVLAEAAQDDAGVWYVPQGTISRRVMRYRLEKDDPNTAIDENYTGTLEYADYPTVDHPNVGDPTFDIYSFLGNNGRFTVTPATGIKLSKRVESAIPGTATDNFQFEVTLTLNGQPYTGAATLTAADGTESPLTLSGGVATLTVGDGQTVYITGLADGVAYSIRELTHEDYAPVGGSLKTGTVALYELSGVEFVNAPITQGSLLITKEVLHSYGDAYAIPEKSFTIRVDLDGNGVANTGFNVTSSTGITTVQTDENGVFEITLGHDDSVMIQGLEAGVTYTITETDLPAGFTLDGSSTGLTGAIESDAVSTAVLYNRYAAAPVSGGITVTGTKTLERQWLPTDSYTFRLEAYSAGAWDEVPGGTATITGADAEKTFDLTAAMAAVPFTAPGSYYFRLVEVPGTDPNITYDTIYRIFLVTVIDDGMSGALTISQVTGYDPTVVTQTANGYHVAANFVNKYTATGTANVTVNILKKLQTPSGADLSLKGFKFGLYDASGNQVGDAAISEIDGTANFSLSYSTADIDNTYTYVIREIDEGKPGVIYSEEWYTVTITITDDITNKDVLNADVVITVADTTETVDLATFTNTYRLTPTQVEIPVTKNLTGRDLVDGEFGFVLIPTDAAFKPLNYAPIIVKNSAQTKFSLEYGTIGTYYYLAGEQIAYSDNGVTYDRTQYHVTVTVTDNGQGGMDHEVSIRQVGGNGNVLVFNNAYTAEPVSIAIEGIKVLDGRHIKDDEFSFVLKDAAGNEIQTVTNEASSGAFAFDAITYDAIGEYHYTVTEVEGDLGGVTYDLNPRTVTVKVTDNGEGKLVAAISGDVNNRGKVVITNTYSATQATQTINVTKRLEGRDLVAGEFTFLLYAADENYNILPGDPLTATNTAGGAVSFYMAYDTPGDYHYVLREDVSVPKGGVTFDDSHYYIRVVVYDDEQGALHATVAVETTARSPITDVEFVNHYSAKPVAVAVDATKKLVGKTLEDGQFTFLLTDAATGQVLQEVKNLADGTIPFENLTFYKAGTYTFLVEEVMDETFADILYDSVVYTLTVEVADNGEGQLVARKTLGVQGSEATPVTLTFYNYYLRNVEVNIHKTVINQRANQYRSSEGFQFSVVYENQEIGRFASDANGDVYFYIQFTAGEVGSYDLYISEVDEGEDYMIYDDTAYHLNIVLELDNDGNLVTKLKLDGEDVTSFDLAFENIYEGVPSVGPDTGDEFQMLLIGSIALICLAGMVVALLMLKKKKPEEN